MGPPMTHPVTAAIPAMAKSEVLVVGNISSKKIAKIHPKVAPMNNAGENIPPKRFNLIHTTVKNNLAINKIINESIVFSFTKSIWIVSEPKPSTSGTNKPIIPHIIPAIIGKIYDGIFYMK